MRKDHRGGRRSNPNASPECLERRYEPPDDHTDGTNLTDPLDKFNRLDCDLHANCSKYHRFNDSAGRSSNLDLSIAPARRRREDIVRIFAPDKRYARIPSDFFGRLPNESLKKLKNTIPERIAFLAGIA
jgi:hypothetical protein